MVDGAVIDEQIFVVGQKRDLINVDRARAVLDVLLQELWSAPDALEGFGECSPPNS